MTPANSAAARLSSLSRFRIRAGSLKRDLKNRAFDAIAFMACGGKIRGGPFRGLRYLRTASCGALPPRLVGTYESELAPIIEAALRTSFDRVVDVGAAEGYYAVGFAARGKAGQVIAFEIEPATQDKLRQLAALNGVTSRLQVRGGADPESLCQALGGDSDREATSTFLLVDVEGYEDTLLDPVAVPALRSAHILVEVHLFVDGSLLERLRARFVDTHDIHFIPQKTTHEAPSASASVHWLARFKAFRSEWRPAGGTPWLLLVPKNSAVLRAGIDAAASLP